MNKVLLVVIFCLGVFSSLVLGVVLGYIVGVSINNVADSELQEITDQRDKLSIEACENYSISKYLFEGLESICEQEDGLCNPTFINTAREDLAEKRDFYEENCR